MRLQDIFKLILERDEDADPKPTGTSADDAGTSTDNEVRKKDVDKSNNDSKPDEPKTPDPVAPPASPMSDGPPGGGMGGPGGQPTPPPKNNFRQEITVGKIVDQHKLSKELENPITKEFVVGEIVRAISVKDLYEFFNVQTQLETPKGAEWLLHLSDDVVKLLKTVQHLWWVKNKPSPTLNTVINAIAKGPPHSIITVNAALERGMLIPFKQLEEFLEPFRIGETVDTPPSGFTTIASDARGNANSQKSDDVGVLIRLYPNPLGQVHALQLYKNEVIRPEGPLARCAGVTKFIVVDKGKYKRCYYVIDLEDQGYEESALQTESIIKDHTLQELHPVYYQYMNTSFKAIEHE